MLSLMSLISSSAGNIFELCVVYGQYIIDVHVPVNEIEPRCQLLLFSLRKKTTVPFLKIKAFRIIVVSLLFFFFLISGEVW